jgi:L-asparaginase
MNRIAIIYMGGTFGCIGTPLTPMAAPLFLRQLQHFFPQSHVDFFAAPNIQDSSTLDIGDWIALSLMIDKLRVDYQHFIVIHGTDTLHYAAACLHHIFAQRLHLIVTGSQYPLLEHTGQAQHPASDAWQNLNFALAQILHIQAGVYLSFNQHIYQAASCYKTHTQDLQAFFGTSTQQTHTIDSLNMLPKLHLQHIEQARQIRFLNYYNVPNRPENIVMDLQSFLQNPPHILILQAFGSGNLPNSPALQHTLQQLLDTGCWVILSSQVLQGALSQQYATGSWLANLPLVFDPHHSQADLYARAVLLYLCHGQQRHWQQFWTF